MGRLFRDLTCFPCRRSRDSRRNQPGRITGTTRRLPPPLLSPSLSLFYDCRRIFLRRYPAAHSRGTLHPRTLPANNPIALRAAACLLAGVCLSVRLTVKPASASVPGFVFPRAADETIPYLSSRSRNESNSAFSSYLATLPIRYAYDGNYKRSSNEPLYLSSIVTSPPVPLLTRSSRSSELTPVVHCGDPSACFVLRRAQQERVPFRGNRSHCRLFVSQASRRIPTTTAAQASSSRLISLFLCRFAFPCRPLFLFPR